MIDWYVQMFSVQATKISLIASILVGGGIAVYTWQEHSSKVGLAIAVALLLISIYEYKTKLVEIRMAFKYEN
jgi:hypothetical protein